MSARARTLLGCLALVAVLGSATVASATSVADVAASLRGDPVYVDPTTSGNLSLTAAQAATLRQQISAAGTPIRIAVLPARALDSTGGDADALLQRIAQATGDRASYALIAGSHFRAGSTVLRRGVAAAAATQAFSAQRDAGAAGVLGDWVRRIGDAAASGDSAGSSAPTGSGGSSSSSSGLLLVLGVIGAGLALFTVRRRRRRRRLQAAQLQAARAVAKQDLDALAEDVLGLDAQTFGHDEARLHYAQASAAYSSASASMESATTVAELEPVTRAIENGRFEMACSQAMLAGRALPERRSPCFFDPRHGPSVGDVEWAPEGGQSRPIPVCAACATEIADGSTPAARQVQVGNRSVPYWQAPASMSPLWGGYYGPWSGGGGGFFGGLLLGEMLGGPFGWGGGYGGGFGGPVVIDDRDGGGSGGGGGGDWGGGGGGDWGGGGGGGDSGGGGGGDW